MKRFFAIFLITGLLTVLSGCFLLPAEEELPKLPLVEAYSGGEMRYETVKKGNLTLSETLECRFVPANEDKHSYSGSSDGKIGQIYFNIGDTVQAGDLLLELADDSLSTAITDAEAELEKLKSELEYYNGNLAIIGNAPELSYRENGYKQLRDALEDKIYLASLRLDSLYDQREAKRMYAAIDGTVTYITSKETFSNGTVVITLTDELSGELYCDTTYYDYFPLGMEHQVEINGSLYDAVVIRAESNAAGLKAGNKRIYFELSGAESVAIQSGRGSVKFVIDSRENVLFVSPLAVISAGGESAVYYKNENGFLSLKPVTVGLETREGIEITGGLSEGEQIVLG